VAARITLGKTLSNLRLGTFILETPPLWAVLGWINTSFPLTSMSSLPASSSNFDMAAAANGTFLTGASGLTGSQCQTSRMTQLTWIEVGKQCIARGSTDRDAVTISGSYGLAVHRRAPTETFLKKQTFSRGKRGDYHEETNIPGGGCSRYRRSADGAGSGG
jgi:hypothetical protein